VKSDSPLKIIFAGTPEFAAIALRELLKTSHHIVAVYTQPDRPAGRGRKLTASPVKMLAMQHQLPVHQPERLREASEQKTIADFQADIMVVAAYGLLLPTEVLNAPRLGCINIHPSLLPRWRGAAPIQRSILAGDSMTGVCIMQMEEGLDTGPVLYQVELPISPLDTGASLHDKLAELGASALVQTLNYLKNNTLHPAPQNPAAVTYAKKFNKEDARIDWHHSARQIDLQIRAFNPWPTAFTMKDGFTFKVWQASITPASNTNAQPGTIIAANAQGITVATGKGNIILEKLQFAGGKIVTANDIANAFAHITDFQPTSMPSFKMGDMLGDAGTSL
jgi:methionyl-tRNA formyltransferase